MAQDRVGDADYTLFETFVQVGALPGRDPSEYLLIATYDPKAKDGDPWPWVHYALSAEANASSLRAKFEAAIETGPGFYRDGATNAHAARHAHDALSSMVSCSMPFMSTSGPSQWSTPTRA